MTSITNVMKKDHERIEEFLSRFLHEQTKENYRKFLWQLERHMFAEEKVIFSNDFADEEINEHKEHILADHSKILKKARVIDLSSKDGIKEFRGSLKKHRNFEDEILYPKLDLVFSKEKISRIVEKMQTEVK